VVEIVGQVDRIGLGKADLPQAINGGGRIRGHVPDRPAVGQQSHGVANLIQLHLHQRTTPLPQALPRFAQWPSANPSDFLFR
jgi:hypothetical protein